MKKIIFVVLALMLVCFSAVAAQETAVEEKSLTFDTVGDMISWETTAEEIYNLLNEYDLEVSVEQDEKYGKTITTSQETDVERFAYVFYFDDETEVLWEVECYSILYNSEILVPAFQALYESYGLEDAEPYENEKLAAYAESFDEAYTAAGDSTIAILAGKAETEDTYAQLALVLINREYFEAI